MMEIKLMTLEEFKVIPEDTIVRIVITAEIVEPRLYVVMKGHEGFHDWSIKHLSVSYMNETLGIYSYEQMLEAVRYDGVKLFSNREILSIFPCTDDVLVLYNYAGHIKG